MDPTATLTGIIEACNTGDRELLSDLLSALSEWNAKEGCLPNIVQTLSALKRGEKSYLRSMGVSLEIPQDYQEMKLNLPVLSFEFDDEFDIARTTQPVDHRLTLWQIAECVSYKLLLAIPEEDQSLNSSVLRGAIAAITKQSALQSLQSVLQTPLDLAYLEIELLLEETWLYKSTKIVTAVRERLIEVFEIEKLKLESKNESPSPSNPTGIERSLGNPIPD